MNTKVRSVAAVLGAILLAGCASSEAGEPSSVEGAHVVEDAPLNVQMDDAIMAGDLALVEALIGAGLGIDDEVTDGATILHLAAMRNQVEIAEYAISEGADLAARSSSGTTPLMEAARFGDGSVLQTLLDAGACPCVINEQMCCGNTALHIAARAGNAATVEVLLNWAADPNILDSHGSTPLIFAAREGRVDVTELLLAAGADINAADGNGSTALAWARMRGFDDVAAVLEAAGATE